MTAALDLTSEWCSLVFHVLCRAGLEDVVVSPGSRSTPLVFAAAQAGLRLHQVIDERSAGFFALGLAKTSGRPALALCTSGSAVAHYLPAAIEATHSGAPLLLLSADRPLELEGGGAMQTIEQTRILGHHAHFVELGAPDGEGGALRGTARRVAQAWAAALGQPAGVVHMNARLRKPLEPRPAESDAERRVAKAARAAASGAALVPMLRTSSDGVGELALALAESRRPLLVCGPLLPSHAAPAVTVLAAKLHAPLYAEATSQLRFRAGAATTADAFALALRLPELDALLQPDLIVQFGGVPGAFGWERFAQHHAATRRFVVNDAGYADPFGGALTLRAAPQAVAASLAAEATTSPARRAFAERVAELGRQLWRAAATLEDGGPLGEHHVARAAVRAASGGTLAVGNSLSIRHVDLFCPAAFADCAVWSQRGASGIDGIVAGAAAAADQRRTVLLLGDVSLLHDVGSLALVGRTRHPLCVVVAHNGGGRIFDQLPASRSDALAPHMSLLTTPHEVDFAHAAALFGLPFERVTDPGALRAALARPGSRLVEARLASDEAESTARRLAQRLREQCGGLLDPTAWA